MAWSSPRTWVAGEAPTAATLNTHIRDQFKAIGDAWASFTPTWTGTTNPAIGNGTLVGAWQSVGKLVNFRITMTAGSTTTFGTGRWSFALPAMPVSGYGRAPFLAEFFDSSASTAYTGYGVWRGSTQTIEMNIFNGAGGVTASVTGTVPMTWATSDVCVVTGTYEAA